MSGLMNVRGVVVSLINKFISPYVDNLNANDLNLAVMAGDLTLHNLHLKKSAVEKYNLPVEVVEGHIGHLHITIPWFSLRTNPVHIQISDVFLLVKMKDTSSENANPAEDEKKEQEAKQERLRNAESLDAAAAAGQGAAGQGEDAKQTWLGAFTQKLVDNVQISIENIHLRYEDNLSTPEHPFAAGFTLSSFKAVSADENWIEAFIQNSSEGVRKLATLDGLAVYFDTDAKSIYRQGDQRGDMMKSFQSLIASKEVDVPHQYILKPVSGESRVIMKKKHSKDVAKTEAQVFFEEIGFVIDDDQYRDALSMLDLFHFYTRTHMYRRFRPPEEAFVQSPAQARWKLATKAILNEVHERNKKWTWEYLAQRRDNRKQYVELYVRTLTDSATVNSEDTAVLEKLEMDLSYEDIRFFRSVAKAQAKKDADLKKKLQSEKQKQQGQQKSTGWLAWAWGSSANNTQADSADTESMTITDDDKQQLNEIIEYDPSAVQTSDTLPDDLLLMRVSATLKRGSLALRTDPHGAKRDLISLVFDTFAADVVQMPHSLDAAISLGDFSVFDGTSLTTIHKKIVQVKEGAALQGASVPGENLEIEEMDPFFTLKFEQNPLDRRADNAVAIKMRHLEIVYHRGYIESITKFLTPPASQLESISALIDAAGETFDGIRRETRAGLEYALDTHKTIDLQVDMNAPIIIIPERIDTKECLYMILDAGHIGVNSTLADKNELKDLQSKRGQSLSDDDFHKLEGLMYDEFSLKLESTQLLIGYKLDACLDALNNKSQSSPLHIIERVGMTFVVRNAMLNLPNLTRFKVSGNLPSLHVNLSDVKYKSLMRIIDIAIPQSSGQVENQHPHRPSLPNPNKPGFRSQHTVQEYILDDDDSTLVDFGGEGDMESVEPDKFYDASDATTEAQREGLHQKTFEFNFLVGELQASLSRSTSNGIEKALAAARLSGFNLDFALRKYDMSVDLGLKQLDLEMLDGSHRQPVIDSGDSQVDDLVKVNYRKVQKESPEYMSVFDGADQSIAVDLSTFRIHAQPEPLLALYDFIMTTFVPNTPPASELAVGAASSGNQDVVQGEDSSDKIRIRVKLRSIELALVNGMEQFATLKLSSADVALLLRAGTMRLTTTLGNLTFVDDTPTVTADPSFKQLLSIEGDELADFSYETFNPDDDATFPGYNSAIKLRTGSLRFTLMEEPLNHLMQFLANLSRLKAFYDRASEAAMQKASEVTKMHYDLIIKTPIVVLPQNGLLSTERVVLRLGQVNAKNHFKHDSKSPDTIKATLSGVNMTTESSSSTLQILDNVDLALEVEEYEASAERPRAQKIRGHANDIHMTLTQKQYILIMDLAETLPGIFRGNDSEDTPEQSRSGTPAGTQTPADVEQPQAISSMTFDFAIPLIRLEVFGAKAVDSATLASDSIAAFAINTSDVSYKSPGDGSSEVSITVRSISMSNTRPGKSVYREIIPLAKRSGNQFTLQYTVTAQPDPAAMALITIDTPQVVLAVDPLYALTDFATAPFKAKATGNNTLTQTDQSNGQDASTTKEKGNPLSYRVEIRHSTILVLASDTEPSSQAIELRIKDIVVAQQAKLTLAIHELGMSFGRMDQPGERVRFLDDVDTTVAMDTRRVAGNSSMSLDVDVTPVIFRASYTDIMLIVDVVNKAAALATAATSPASVEAQDQLEARRPSVTVPSQSLSTKSKGTQNRRRSSVKRPEVIVSKQTLHTRIGGFQLVLIGDMQDLPLLHLSTKPFSLNVNDWSTDLHAKTAMSSTINYYNLVNSHWEPLMDPWEFALTVAKASGSGDAGTMAVKFSSKQRLELNLTAAFIELMITSATIWSQQGERIGREGPGVDAPFVVRNRTGYTLLVWSDSDKSNSKGKSVQVKRLADNQAIPWRFQDHKRQRENLSSSSHNAFGIQFEGTSWERVRNVSVDREGDRPYSLKPRMNNVLHRVVCDVKLKDNVKVVTFRSAFQVENMTHLPMELVLLDASNKQAAPVAKIPPGETFPLPIEAAYGSRFKLRPDRGFDYAWSSDTMSWQDLIRRPVRAIACKHKQPNEAQFRFQASCLFDKKDPTVKQYPKMSLRLRAPIEIENLLPYNIRYRVYDKNTRGNTTNFLIRGGSSPIHTVQLDHLLLLSVEAQDSGFKQSEFAIINTDNPDDFRTEDTLVLHDKRDQKLNLKLHYITYPDAGGAIKVQIYSPYIVLNKTGLPFSLAFKTWSGTQSQIAGQEAFNSDYNQTHPTPFMFSFPTEERNNRLLIRVGNSSWSKPVSVEGVGADSEITLHDERSHSTYHLGLSYQEGLGKYKLSKVITLAPRFLIRNESNRIVKIRQFRTQNYLDIRPEQRVPWHSFNDNAPTLFSFALEGADVRWSSPINVADVGRNHVVVPTAGGTEKSLLRVDVRLEGASIFLFVKEEDGQWPLSVRNETDFTFTFEQMEENAPNGPPQDRAPIPVEPKTTVDYSWDTPAATGKRIRLIAQHQERIVDIMEIGVQTPFKVAATSRNGSRRNRTFSLDVRAEGQSQILVILPYDEDNSIYRPKRPGAGLVRSDSVDSFNAMSFETVLAPERPTLTVSVELEGLGISLVNRNLHELLYASIRGIKFAYSDYPHYYDASLDCKWIQIDNQLFGGLFPIILYPTVVPKDGKELEAHPTLQLSVAVLKDDKHGVTYVKYASLLLQAMTVELDEDFLFAVYEFSKFENASWQEPVHDVLIGQPGEIPDAKETPPGTNVYFEDLALQPMQLELSFMRTERVNVDDKSSSRNPVVFFFNALTMALGNVNAAPVRLNALIIHNARVTLPSLQERVMLHYREQVMAQLYRVLGSADFLGNPVGLFNNVSSGVQDIFYEPIQGVVMHGHRDLGIGIARGASSFAKKTVFGITDSLTKVTGSVGKGLAAATLDSDYQARRRMAQRRNKPKHALYGFASGANSFATSVASGFEGLALKPIEGAESGGVGGFFKGVGKGFVGAVTKPVVGVFDFASNVTEGIRNTTTVFDQNDIDRVRLPRYIGPDGILRPFAEREAFGQYWLKDLENGRYFKDVYVAHLDLPGDDSIIMLTTSRILLVRTNNLKVSWEVPFDDLQTISLEPNGISLVLMGDVNGPFLPVVGQRERSFLFKHIETVVKQHNEARKSTDV